MKLHALISGGIDSPVAAWRMRQLGHEVSFVHFHNYTPQQAAVRQKVIDLVNVVGGGRLWMDFTDVEFRDMKVEMPVELSFRRKYLDKGRGIAGYSWKAVPVPAAKEVQ